MYITKLHSVLYSLLNYYMVFIFWCKEEFLFSKKTIEWVKKKNDNKGTPTILV